MSYTVKVDAFGHAELICDCVSCRRSREKADERVCKNCGEFTYKSMGCCPVCETEIY